MLVGDCWGEQDERVRSPFQGTSGQELNRLLHEAGIMRSECYATNLVNKRPPWGDLGKWIAGAKKDITPTHIKLSGEFVLSPIAEGFDRLHREIALVQPNLIIALGNWALWALTGMKSTMKWRGSQLSTPLGVKVLPTYHPSYILRDWSQRATTVLDLKRAARGREYPGPWNNTPKWSFQLRPSFRAAYTTLNELISRLDSGEALWLDFDLETSIQTKHIRCAGISWSATEAICIPFTDATNPEGYWLPEEEGTLVYLLYRLLCHPLASVRGQNLLFDCQYTYRYWHFVPRVKQDTMISHHSIFAGMKKSLDFQASMYCDYYKQWKPDKATWKNGG